MKNLKKILICLVMLVVLFTITACGQTPGNTADTNTSGIETPGENEENSMNRLKISTNGGELIATLASNSSANALKELITENGGTLTINMSDYGNFEKVGSLGTSLPTNNTQITTIVGDIMLYQGNSIVIFYDSNTWSYTRLGKIDASSKQELLAVLGQGNVTITLSLIK